MTESVDLQRRAALGAGLGTALAVVSKSAAAAPTPGASKSSLPTGSMRVWEMGPRANRQITLRLASRPIPTAGPGQVVLKVLATGINAVDLSAIKAAQPLFASGPQTQIPLQDNVSIVAALGPGVTTLSVGDRVTTTLYTEWTSGPWDVAYMRTMPGLRTDGFLAEYVVMPANTLVPVPAHFSDEGAATLAIAGLTAWRALAIEAKVRPGETVVTTGTGGVSVFNIQLAKILGARVIVTSSSDDKLTRVKALGADELINYRTTPDWATEVLKRTDGRGANVVLNNVGWDEMTSSLRACASNARVIHIGAGPAKAPIPNWPNMIGKNIWVKSFTMAGREMLEHMLRALRNVRLEPIVDRVFPFEQAVDAVRFMEKSSHIGKVVIRVGA